jgi:hypothetical protein
VKPEAPTNQRMKGKTSRKVVREQKSGFFLNRKRPEGWPPQTLLGELFVLEQREDGSVEAKLSVDLQYRFDSLWLGMEKASDAGYAYSAILALLKVGDDLRKREIYGVSQLPWPVVLPDGSIRRDVEREKAATRLIVLAFFVAKRLRNVFAPLKASKGTHLEEAKKNAKKVMNDVIDRLASKLPLKTDKRKEAIRLDELNCDVPVSFLAIEHARKLAARHQRLPSKAEVCDSLLDVDPELSVSRSYWSKVWIEAGLDDLPKGFSKRKWRHR